MPISFSEYMDLYLEEISRIVGVGVTAEEILTKIGFDEGYFPANFDNSREFWFKVGKIISNGQIPNCNNIDPLIYAIQQRFPGNSKLKICSENVNVTNLHYSSISKFPSIFLLFCKQDKVWVDRLQTVTFPIFEAQSYFFCSKKSDEAIQAIKNAQAAIVFVSIDFLGSPLSSSLLFSIIERAHKRKLTLSWIPVTDALYNASGISNFMPLWEPQRPLSSLESAELDSAWVEIARKIRSIILS